VNILSSLKGCCDNNSLFCGKRYLPSLSGNNPHDVVLRGALSKGRPDFSSSLGKHLSLSNGCCHKDSSSHSECGLSFKGCPNDSLPCREHLYSSSHSESGSSLRSCCHNTDKPLQLAQTVQEDMSCNGITQLRSGVFQVQIWHSGQTRYTGVFKLENMAASA
jgi:hypothetical protein